MSSTGSGYDYSCGTFSPDGRIFQVEYAQKAVENSGTAVGIKCSDGIVIAIGKPQASKMLVHGSNRQVYAIDTHAGICVTGYAADGRQVVSRAREEAQSYKETYGEKIVPSVLSNRLSLFFHYFTIYGSLRPFGSSALIAAYDSDVNTPELYMIEPSGTCFKFLGCAAGRGANAAKTELEKLLSKNAAAGVTCRQAVKELARILHLIRDESKEKPLELEMGWLCAENDWKYMAVSQTMVDEADAAAKASLAGESSTGSVTAAAVADAAPAEEPVPVGEESTMDVADA